MLTLTPPRRPLSRAQRPAPSTPLEGPAVQTQGAVKTYRMGTTEVRALDSVSVAVERSRFTAIMGPSGSGKSTLLQTMAGLDRLTEGEVWIGDVALSTLRDRQLTELRRDCLGFIFQAFNLIPTLNVAENIRLPLDLAGRAGDPTRIDQIIDTLDLGDRLGHRPSELSGGQQQRVAVARALVGRPDIVFGDEPTGNLDTRSAAEILAFLRSAVDAFGQTVVMVTHDPKAAANADRVLFLADGRIVDDLSDPTAEMVFDRMRSIGEPVTGGRS